MKRIFQFVTIISFLIVPIIFCQAQISNKDAATSEKSIVIVLDNSGSMKKNDPKFLTKAVVKNFINRADVKTKIAILIFDKEIKLSLPLTLMTTQENKLNAEKIIEDVNYNGLYTNIPIAIERAIYELKINSKPNSLRSIILLTDGYIDTGDKGQDAVKQDWLKNDLTQEARKENIKIFGIAFTENADYQLMQLLAEKTGSDYYRALSPKDIETVFNKIHEKIAVLKPAIDRQSQKEKQPSTEKINFLLILGAIIVVIVGIVAIVRIIRPKTAVDTTDESPVPPAKLVSSENRKEFILKKAMFSIGRHKINELRIPFDTISGSHAFIKFRDNKFYLFDNHSSNSTYLNGKKIVTETEIELKNNDEIKFDIYKYTFILPVQEETEKTILRIVNDKEETGTVLRIKEVESEKQDNKNKESKKESFKPVSAKEVINADEEEELTELKQAFCPNHTAYKAMELCPICKKAFCKLCMVEKEGKTICKSCAIKA
ncbi:VWA domain-containing protein [Patescibacteria group bacterium]|nr:VWA domain-containing protein [Patescibacteria group bacterium]